MARIEHTVHVEEYAPDNLEQCCAGAMVRRVTETQQYVMNGYPAGDPIQRVLYECARCERRLGVAAQGEE